MRLWRVALLAGALSGSFTALAADVGAGVTGQARSSVVSGVSARPANPADYRTFRTAAQLAAGPGAIAAD